MLFISFVVDITGCAPFQRSLRLHEAAKLSRCQHGRCVILKTGIKLLKIKENIDCIKFIKKKKKIYKIKIVCDDFSVFEQ